MLCLFRATVGDEKTDDIITSDSHMVAAASAVDHTGMNVCGVE